MHVCGGQARSPAYTFTAMEGHGAAADVLSYGVDDCIELTCRDRLGIFDSNVRRGEQVAQAQITGVQLIRLNESGSQARAFHTDVIGFHQQVRNQLMLQETSET